MNALFKRLLYFLGTGSVFLAACKVDYGMPADVDYFKAVKVKTEQNEPIQGLSVSLIENDDTFFVDKTNTNGIVPIDYEFFNEVTYKVFIQDTDGEENLGEFKSQTSELSNPDTTEVVMQKKE